MHITKVHWYIYVLALLISVYQGSKSVRANGHCLPLPDAPCVCEEGWAGPPDCTQCDGTGALVSGNVGTEQCGGQGATVALSASINSAYVSPPYYFSVDGEAISNNSQYTLQAGTHTAVAYAALGEEFCIIPYNPSNAAFPFTILQSSYPALQLNATLTYPAGCGTGSDYEMHLEASGGVPLYSFTFSDGTSENNTNKMDVSFTAPATSTKYAYNVTDSVGCMAGGYIYLQTVLPLGIERAFPNPTLCPGLSLTGSVSITTTGGRGAISYSLDGIVYQHDNGFNEITGGDHNIYLKDSTGCTFNSSFHVQQPPALLIEDAPDTTCSSPVTLTGGGGSTSYKFAMDDSLNFTTDTVFYNVPAGNHYFVVHDFFGCSNVTTTRFYNTLTVEVTTTPATCTTPGSIEYFVTHGTPPYTYNIGSQSKVSSTNTSIDIEAGLHNYSVTDNKGCTFTGTVQIYISDPNIAQGVSTLSPNPNDGGTIGFTGNFPAPITVFFLGNIKTLANCTATNSSYLECQTGPGTGQHTAEIHTGCSTIDIVWNYEAPVITDVSPMFYQGSNMTISGHNFGTNSSVPVTVTISSGFCIACSWKGVGTIFCTFCSGGAKDYSQQPIVLYVDGIASEPFYFHYGGLPLKPYAIYITPDKEWAAIEWHGDVDSFVYKLVLLQDRTVVRTVNSTDVQTTRNFNFTMLSPNTTYTVQIQEQNPFGTTAFAIQNFTTLSNSSNSNNTIVPVDPYDIDISAYETWAFTTWKGDVTSSSYNILLKNESGTLVQSNSSDFSARSINFTNLLPNSTYTVKIQEQNLYGYSGIVARNFTTLSTVINCDSNNGGCDQRVSCTNASCSACPNGTYGNPRLKCNLYCGDGGCDASVGEDCVSCPYDCRSAQCDICGDLSCSSTETCASCSKDCGACNSPKCDKDCSGHGICISGHCVCNENFVGPSCSLQNNQPIDVGINQSNPSVTLTSQKVKFESSVISISEVSASSHQIRFYEISEIHFSLSNYTEGVNIYNNYTSTLDNGATLSVIIAQIEQSTTITFAGVTTTYPQHTLKVSLSINKWPFTALSNTLAITFGSSAESSKISCTKQSEDGDNTLRWIMVVVDDVALYGQFLDKALIDGRVQKIAYYLNENKTVTAVLPHFWDTAGMDPDFSVLLADPSATCTKSSNNWKKIVAIVIPVVFVAFVAVALFIYFYPKIHRRLKVKKQRIPSSPPEIEIEHIKGYEVNSSAGKFNMQL
eukprot:Phypoly_transcript_00962.p1 GENE.Phypoly_transcript_00962~~Phypoly_transcript_00962.p1  ORF type:complete len:1230 (+),score=107.09 Phypoly_transcript_00962:136-3825(+)